MFCDEVISCNFCGPGVELSTHVTWSCQIGIQISDHAVPAVRHPEAVAGSRDLQAIDGDLQSHDACAAGALGCHHDNVCWRMARCCIILSPGGGTVDSRGQLTCVTTQSHWRMRASVQEPRKAGAVSDRIGRSTHMTVVDSFSPIQENAASSLESSGVSAVRRIEESCILPSLDVYSMRLP